MIASNLVTLFGLVAATTPFTPAPLPSTLLRVDCHTYGCASDRFSVAGAWVPVYNQENLESNVQIPNTIFFFLKTQDNISPKASK